MDYNARFYSASLGRFVSPDTVVPGVGNPMAWDGYQYTNSNPINNTDPSGNITCGDDITIPECQTDPDLAEELMSARVLNIVPVVPDAFKNGLKAYLRIRDALIERYGLKYVNEDGLIDDQALLALIIGGEFGTIPSDSAAFKESLEALSAEYNDAWLKDPGYDEDRFFYGCLGSCDTVLEQVKFLTLIESLRTRDIDAIFSDFETNMGYAKSAMDPNYMGPVGGRDSWIWGNYDNGSKMETFVETNHDASKYVASYDGNNLNYIVLTKTQNNAMNANGWKCGTSGPWVDGGYCNK